MIKKQYVDQLKVKEAVESIFLVKFLSVMESRDGKNYLNIILSDKTGKIEARKWHGAHEVHQLISAGDYARVIGKVNNFQGRSQLIIKEIYKEETDKLSLEDYQVKSEISSDKMLKELEAIIFELSDVYIKDLLSLLINDPDIRNRLRTWYAGKSIHHAYEAGLLEHILSCTKLAIHLSPIYNVNKNYVVAGAIMHDLCKIYELSSGPVVEYTTEGKLVGHLTSSIELMNRFIDKIKGFPYQTKLHLQHILLSHHGAYEYGSPKLPQTSEAQLVHFIDLMDSQMNSMETVKKDDSNTGSWTGFIRHLDRVVYKDKLPSYLNYIDEKLEKKQNKEELTHTLADKLKGLKIE